MYKIDDEIHAELQEGEFESFELALEELKKRANIAWNEEPNRCPCMSWETCERKYQIVEYDNSTVPWKQLNRKDICVISSKGVFWEEDIKAQYNIA